MAEKNEVVALFTVLSKALETHSAKELADGVTSILQEKKRNYSKEIETLFDIVCLEFKIPRMVLCTKNVRGNANEAKQIIYCILHFELKLPIRKIAVDVFSTWGSVIHKAIKRFQNIDESIKADHEFLTNYNKIVEKFNNQKSN